jgi:NAD(P)-dependent dehydrogenase (short-subunit alcohol dehydrogenase family)
MPRQAHTPQIRADDHAAIPLDRHGTPEEIAEAAGFPCSDAASYVTTGSCWRSTAGSTPPASGCPSCAGEPH